MKKKFLSAVLSLAMTASCWIAMPASAADTWIANSKVSDTYTCQEVDVTNADGVTVKAQQFKTTSAVDAAAYSLDLSAMTPDLTSLKKAKGTLTVSFDFLIDGTSDSCIPSSDGYIDLSMSNEYSYGATDTRLARVNLYKGWNQLNFYGATANRVNGSNTGWTGDNSKRWYTITEIITLDATNTANNTAQIEVRNESTEGLLNKKAFEISNADFSKALSDSGALYLNVMPTRTSKDAVEFYIKNVSASFAGEMIDGTFYTITDTTRNGADTDSFSGGTITLSANSGLSGQEIMLTPQAFYGFQLQSLVADGTPLTDNNGYHFALPAKNVEVKGTFGLTDANTEVKYFYNDAALGRYDGNTGSQNPRKGKDLNIYQMNYVDNGSQATFTGINKSGKVLKSIDIISTLDSSAADKLIRFNNGAFQTAASLYNSSIPAFKAGDNTFNTFTVNVDAANQTADTITLDFQSTSGGFCGNYWYLLLNYEDEAAKTPASTAINQAVSINAQNADDVPVTAVKMTLNPNDDTVTGIRWTVTNEQNQTATFDTNTTAAIQGQADVTFGLFMKNLYIPGFAAEDVSAQALTASN